MIVGASYIVFNGEDFFEQSLRSIYDWVNFIMVAEGPVEGSLLDGNYRIDEEGNWTSIDRTIEILQENDPDKKIVLIRKRRAWKNKLEMKQEILKWFPRSAEWLLNIDHDEIYAEKDLKTIRSRIEQYPNAIMFRWGALHFWHDFHHTITTKQFGPWTEPHDTLVNLQYGLQIRRHHCLFEDKKGRYLRHHKSLQRLVKVLPVKFYHLGEARDPERMLEKFIMQKRRGFGEVEGSPKDEPWFSGELGPEFVLSDYSGPWPQLIRDHPRFSERRIEITQQDPPRFRRLEG